MFRRPDIRPWYCGERHHKAKLDSGQVIEIIEAIDRRAALRKELASLTDRAIGEKYGVSQTAIHNIAVGKTWKHI